MSENMSTVVEVFVERINTIDEQVGALSELKGIINEFLQTMIRNGITKISALPLLYEEMDKQLTVLEDRKPVTYKELTAINEKLQKEFDISIVDLPAMRMLSSKHKDNGLSDADGFTNWLILNNILRSLPGSPELFDYQDNENDAVLLRRIDDTYENDSPFIDIKFNGGLFAVGSLFVDEDIGMAYRNIIHLFDGNKYYKVDYQHDGRLRQDFFIKNVLSPNEKRERINVYLAVKKRLPDASFYEPGERAKNISTDEIKSANPVLWTKELPVNVEIEHKRHGTFSTGITVQYPFRVDMIFRVGEEFIPEYSGAGRWIPSIVMEYGDEYYGVNMTIILIQDCVWERFHSHSQ